MTTASTSGRERQFCGERQHVADGLAPLLEDLDVGVPEAVDRLELVADEEEVVARDQVDQLALEAVRVLELVDADLAEAQLLALADRVVAASRSRARSWRSSKSSADSRSFAAW